MLSLLYWSSLSGKEFSLIEQISEKSLSLFDSFDSILLLLLPTKDTTR